MQVTFRPLTTWAPRPSTPDLDRRWSPFMRRESGDSYRRVPMSLTTTLRELEREISMLGGSNVIIGIGLRERDIRNDGWPRADAPQPAHPGVEVSFDSRYGRLTYATVKAWDEAHAAWFPTVNARPFDADASARAAIKRTDAAKALRQSLDSLQRKVT